MKQLHINYHVAMWPALRTEFNIKECYTVKLSLIDRNNSKTNHNELLMSFHLVISTIYY